VFNIGTNELLIILVLVFLLFGPRHIPEVARTVGKGLGEIRRTLQGVEDSVRRTTSELPDFDEMGRRAGRGPDPKAHTNSEAKPTEGKKVPDPFYASLEGSSAEADKDAEGAESKES
jgi:TatA/E family protein of Tat protein translocase